MPDGAGFPDTAPVLYYDRGIIETGVGIGADRMRQVMVHKA
jgi:hypothetical protein